MAQKKIKRASKKGKGKKISITKLSNKRLNKLAKQGKLKKKLPKYKLLNLAKERTGHDVNTIQGEVAEVEDIPLDDTDFEYFGKGSTDLHFLTGLSASNDERRGKKRKKGKEDEASFEKIPRKLKENEKETIPLLPVKGKEGIIPRSLEVEQEEEDAEKEVKEAGVPEPLPALSTADLFLLRQQKIQQAKQRIAILSSSIIEKPEEKTGNLRELRLMLTEADPDVYITVCKLAMASLLEVFNDIIPGYKIRLLSDKEKSQSMKKETKQLRHFEESLLSNYRHYLEFLESVLRGKPPKSAEKKSWKKKLNGALKLPKEAKKTMQELALRCLCDLLAAHPHFNLRTNIMALLVPYMDHKNVKMSSMVCNCIKRAFKEDKIGDLSLEAVRLIAKLVKNKNFNVQAQVLETFLSLKVKEVKFEKDEEDNKKENKKLLSRREKKRQKQMKYLEKELTDAAAMDDKKYKLRMNTQITEAVFLTYFRILKNGQDSILLSTVLEGLAKFAHLINIDFFEDLFSVLNELVESNQLTYRESLHCVQTAFTILTGQGSSLNIDPLRFYKHLYNTLFYLHAGISSVDTPIALECIEMMFNKRRKQVSVQRLLAMIKRMVTLSLTQTTEGSLASLAAARSLMSLNHKSDILYDLESQGSGVFMPELDEPEHCNAHNTAVFELHLLKKHYHPAVAKYSHHLLHSEMGQASNFPSEFSRKTPVELFHEYDTSELDFNPTLESVEKQIPKKAKQCQTEFLQKEFNEELKKVFASKNDCNLPLETNLPGNTD